MMMMMMMQRQLRVHFAGNAKEVTFRLAVILVYLFFIAVCSVLFKGAGRGITILIFECSCPTVCSMIISPFFFLSAEILQLSYCMSLVREGG